jgi:hypothetical protein
VPEGPAPRGRAVGRGLALEQFTLERRHVGLADAILDPGAVESLMPAARAWPSLRRLLFGVFQPGSSPVRSELINLNIAELTLLSRTFLITDALERG